MNKYKPHVLVLPEDDADRQLANGFIMHPTVRSNRIQVLPEAGGWRRVLELFESDHVRDMAKYPHRSMVMLFDFDSHIERLEEAKAAIPANLTDRAFVFGVFTEPEELKAALGFSFEKIWQELAEDCHKDTGAVWRHHLLQHNASELERLRRNVQLILFE